MSDAGDLVVRPAARVILFDADDHLLLFRYHDEAFVSTDHPGLFDYWITPGGGREAGESLEQTARRELAEETGIEGVALSPCVAVRHIVLTIHGVLTRCEEHFFVARCPGRRPEIDTSRQFDHELDVLREIRWWHHADLPGAGYPVMPTGLPAFVPTLLGGALPSTPVRLEG